MKKRDVGVMIAIWMLALVVIHTGIRPYAGGDGTLELWRTGDTIQYGWHLQSADQNNTSIALNMLAPVISKTFNLSPVAVFRDIFSMVYALTPVLLFLIFRRVMSSGAAFFSAAFFIILPPSYQEIPNIAKSMIAEPLAAASLLFLCSHSRFRSSLSVCSSVLLSLLAALSHYTVGIFLVAWYTIAAIATRRKYQIIAIVVVVGMIMVGYFWYVGNGAVIRGIMGWGDIGVHNNDSVRSALSGGEFSTYSSRSSTTLYPLPNMFYPLRLPFVVPAWIMTLVIRLAVVVLFAGGIWWCVNDVWKRHRELSTMIAMSAVLVLCALYIPFFTQGLYLSRWIQLSAIPMCGLYGMGTYWMPKRFSYPIASVILLLLLVVVR